MPAYHWHPCYSHLHSGLPLKPQQQPEPQLWKSLLLHQQRALSPIQHPRQQAAATRERLCPRRLSVQRIQRCLQHPYM